MFTVVAVTVGIVFICAIASGVRQGTLARAALQLRHDQARAIGEAILDGLKSQRLPNAEPRRALMRPGEMVSAAT